MWYWKAKTKDGQELCGHCEDYNGALDTCLAENPQYKDEDIIQIEVLED